MTATAWVLLASLWVVVLSMGVLVFGLARQIGVILERIGPVGALHLATKVKIGEPAPVVNARDLNGEPRLIGTPRAGNRSLLIVFLSPSCPACKELLLSVRALRRTEHDRLEILLASDGERDPHVRFVAEHSLQDFPYVISEQLGLRYGVSRLPYAVMIDAAGIVRASGIVNNREHLESLLEAERLGVPTMQALAAIKQTGV